MTLDPYGQSNAFYSSSKSQVCGEQLISMSTEEDIIATLTTSNSYINVNENAIECSFHSLEVVNAIFVGIGKRVPIPRLSNVTK